MAESSPRFRRLLRRAQWLRVREMSDGCLDCIGRLQLCGRHLTEAIEMVIDPTDYFENDLVIQDRIGEGFRHA